MYGQSQRTWSCVSARCGAAPEWLVSGWAELLNSDTRVPFLHLALILHSSFTSVEDETVKQAELKKKVKNM